MTTTRQKRSGQCKPELLVLSMQEAEEILERARSGTLSEDDCAKLKAVVETVAWLHQELDEKTLTIARLRSLFGLKTSERTSKVLGEESEKDRDEDEDEQPDEEGGATDPEEAKKPKKRKKRKGHGRHGAADYEGAERIEVLHASLKAGDVCPACTTEKKGKVYVLRNPAALVRIVGQAALTATVYELERLRCNLCGKVFTADSPPGVGDEKYDESSAAMIALLRYGNGLPFHRLERLQGNLGIPLPAATQWEIVADAALKATPAHEELIRQAAQGRLMHNDDTSMQVLDLRKEIDRAKASGEAESDRTGIFSTSIVSELEDGHRIAVYFTGRQHAGENITDLLRQRAAELEPPMQMCDGLDRNVPKEFKTILANCLGHGRRKFVELVSRFPRECRHVLETLRDVFKNDAETRKRKLSDEERLRYHQTHSGPLMKGLKDWMETEIEEKRIEPNSALGGAIAYMTKRWDQLTLFLRKPGAPLENNICERALKKAILHRRNSLFYKTENGARVGDTFMGLIHSAELAGANPFDYLVQLLKHAPDVQLQPGQWMPWNYRDTLAEAESTSTAP